MSSLRDYKTKVMKLLELHESARNSDGSLYAHFINTHCKHLTVLGPDNERMVPLKNFRLLPPMETIGRCRRIIQNENSLYEPTDPKVREARNIKERNWREAEVREAKPL